MHVERLHDALERLSQAIREVENQLAAMKAEHTIRSPRTSSFLGAIIETRTTRKAGSAARSMRA
jgi:hypothetical protein